MNKTAGIIIGIVGLVALVAGLTIVMNNDDSSDTANNSSQQASPNDAVPSNNEEKQDMIENSDQTVDIVMSNFEFSQNKIEAKPGDTVTINLSVDSGSHDFVIDELDVQSETIGSSDTDMVTFTIPEDAAGQTHAYYCSIGNHRSQGMEGELVISN